MPMSKAAKPRNRVTRCPACQGKLGFDRDAVTLDNRFIYRSRPCMACGAVIHTKQPPEEITGVELPATISVNTEHLLVINAV